LACRADRSRARARAEPRGSAKEKAASGIDARRAAVEESRLAR
jgi:hypothetical protein